MSSVGRRKMRAESAQPDVCGRARRAAAGPRRAASRVRRLEQRKGVRTRESQWAGLPYLRLEPTRGPARSSRRLICGPAPVRAMMTDARCASCLCLQDVHTAGDASAGGCAPEPLQHSPGESQIGLRHSICSDSQVQGFPNSGADGGTDGAACYYTEYTVGHRWARHCWPGPLRCGVRRGRADSGRHRLGAQPAAGDQSVDAAVGQPEQAEAHDR